MFVLECLKQGVLTNGNILVSYAHDNEAIERTLVVFEQAVQKIFDAIDQTAVGSTNGTDFAHDASSVEVKGCVDSVFRQTKGTFISGWALVEWCRPR